MWRFWYALRRLLIDHPAASAAAVSGLVSVISAVMGNESLSRPIPIGSDVGVVRVPLAVDVFNAPANPNDLNAVTDVLGKCQRLAGRIWVIVVEGLREKRLRRRFGDAWNLRKGALRQNHRTKHRPHEKRGRSAGVLDDYPSLDCPIGYEFRTDGHRADPRPFRVDDSHSVEISGVGGAGGFSNREARLASLESANLSTGSDLPLPGLIQEIGRNPEPNGRESQNDSEPGN